MLSRFWDEAAKEVWLRRDCKQCASYSHTGSSDMAKDVPLGGRKERRAPFDTRMPQCGQGYHRSGFKEGVAQESILYCPSFVNLSFLVPRREE